jgi:tripartite-type tricarboxylate transporter receptor subunit TctC
MAPAGTPADVVSQLIAAVATLSKDPTVIERAERAGYAWIGASPEALKQKMAEEVAQSQEVIRFSGIKAE